MLPPQGGRRWQTSIVSLTLARIVARYVYSLQLCEEDLAGQVSETGAYSTLFRSPRLFRNPGLVVEE